MRRNCHRCAHQNVGHVRHGHGARLELVLDDVAHLVVLVDVLRLPTHEAFVRLPTLQGQGEAQLKGRDHADVIRREALRRERLHRGDGVPCNLVEQHIVQGGVTLRPEDLALPREEWL